MSSLVAGYATGKITEFAESFFRTHVIERWGRYRATQFFDTFCKAVTGDDTKECEVQQLLDDLLKDEKRSEILFDAYRSVCLTRSKEIGPRVLALLTAELITSGKSAGAEECSIFSAAEELSDNELVDFCEFATKHSDSFDSTHKQRTTRLSDGSIAIQMGEESFDLNWQRDDQVSLGPMDLANEIGTWAPKLKNHGLLTDDVKERQWEYDEDSERHIDESGAIRQITWWLYLPVTALRFAKLIDKVSQNNSRVGLVG